jgi:hypothetical protein
MVWTLNVDALRMPSMHQCGHLDPRETIGMRGVHEYNRLELVAMKTNGNILVMVGREKLWR